MGKALPHMRCRLVSVTLSAAVSPTCIPTSLSRSLMVNGRRVERERSLCDRSLAIRVGHFKRGRFNASVGTFDPSSRQSCQVIGIVPSSPGSCLSGGNDVQHSRTRACAQYFERSSQVGSPNQCAILSRWVFKCGANGVHSNM
eukprot:scaffold2080_cov428-Pavlova_lutheri.AAC.1